MFFLLWIGTEIYCRLALQNQILHIIDQYIGSVVWLIFKLLLDFLCYMHLLTSNEYTQADKAA